MPAIQAPIPRPIVQTNQAFIVVSVLSAWATGVHWLIALPLAAGLLGLLFNYNPVMRIARRFLRKPPSAYVPEDPAQQRFNQLIAVSLLALGIISFSAGWTAAGYALTAMVAAAAFVALLGFCVGCFIHYQWSQYKHRKNTAKTQ